MPRLDKINEKFQSDKGGKHCYLNEYYQLKFDPIRLDTKKLLEIGVYEGASIRLWKDFFVNADIYALEKLHKRSGMFDDEDRIHLVIGDSTSWESYSSIPNDIDIIIDDGSHKPQDQFSTFQQAFNKLADGGLYIIEDVRDIESLSSLLKEINFNIYDFRNKAEPDSVIFEIVK